MVFFHSLDYRHTGFFHPGVPLCFFAEVIQINSRRVSHGCGCPGRGGFSKRTLMFLRRSAEAILRGSATGPRIAVSTDRRKVC